jgi:hypothetical protein
MVCGHIGRMLSRLSATSCAKYEAYIGTCPVELSSRLNEFSLRLNLKLVARLRLKFEYLNQTPIILIGGIGYLHGHCSKAESQDLVREGLKQRDDAVRAGRTACLHRVARKLSLDDGEYSRCLEAFVASEEGEIDDTTHVCLRDYSLGKVVTRKTEAAHAHIKSHIGKKVLSPRP